MTASAASQMACHECDLLVAVPHLDVGQKAFCPRCDHLLAANRRHAQQRIFAFAVSALVFLILAGVFPFLEFSAKGQERTVTLFESIAILVTANFPSLAAIIFTSIIAIPGAFLAGVIYFSSSFSLRRLLPGTRIILRWVLTLVPWSMAEIFLVGILVSFIKISSMADVALRQSFWAYFLFSICMTVVTLHLDKRELWRRVSQLIDA